MSHIVIADDEDDVREFLLRAVRRYAPQAEVTAVVNGAAALEMISQRGCDLLISDHRMPVMTGVELLQAVLQVLDAVFHLAPADGQLTFEAASDRKIGPQRMGFGIDDEPVHVLLGARKIAGPEEHENRPDQGDG